MRTIWTRPVTRFAISAIAVAGAFAVVLAVVWTNDRGGADWSGTQREALQVLVESELPKATASQQVCVVEYVVGRFKPDDWTTVLERSLDPVPFSGNAVHTEASASGCVSK